MNDSLNYEKAVKRKSEGGLLITKILLIASYVIFASVGGALVFLFANGHPILLLLVALLDFCLWLLTHRLFEVEYEYAFLSGNFYLSKIMGRASRKELFEEEISKAVRVAPYNDPYRSELEKQAIEKTFFAVSSKSADNIWFILFESENGRSLIIFEADERALKCLRHSAPRAISREKLTHTQNDREDTQNA